MAKTYTTTLTFTQTDVVIMQYDIAFEYAGVLKEEQKKKVLKAIREEKISAMGIYAYDSNHKRVAEVEIKVDWKKHNQTIQLYGEAFNYTGGGFNFKTGEAAETKIYVNELVKLANANRFTLSCWVRLVSSLSETERTNTLKRIGFNGGKPAPWRGDLEVDHKEVYGAIPQMEIAIRAAKI